MMRRLCTSIVVGVAGLVLCADPAFAQAKAKATTPEIPYDSVNFISKMPPGLYMATSLSSHAAVSRGCSNSIATATSSRSSAKGATVMASLTPSASTRMTTSGQSTKAPTSSSNTRPTASS